ncbi:CLUMA_CG007806, isoform A [Clunio marinus]|uniref:CLUMA_CG007806, isoform A n=1 Tax=Clunio marinus TaxID=568069 RepID=A0A1J1I257_9DIPT|nr:CLUMA_CG007806, isoform A [Clunio marinus]
MYNKLHLLLKLQVKSYVLRHFRNQTFWPLNFHFIRLLNDKQFYTRNKSNIAIMSREQFYFLPEGAPPTFSRDEMLEKLPLPKLEDSLKRYYRNLLPFGSDEELAKSRKIIEDFKNGDGKKLQKMLEDKAAKERNWVERWWEDLAYHSVNFPLMPYQNMAMPLIVSSVGIEETPENRLKTLARGLYYSAIFWELIRSERMRPPTNPDGSITFSANLYKRLYNTCRVPGEIKDEIHEHFKVAAEGDCPKTCLVIGRGRVFYFEFIIDGQIMSPQEILNIIMLAHDQIVNSTSVPPGIPILTSDYRTNWAKNRKHLIELSPSNKKLLEIIESAAFTLSLDDNEPIDYSELAQKTLQGDFHSRWNDKSSNMISFRNGKVGLVGEHSAYDGTISIAFSTFLLMSMMEDSEPDWNELPKHRIIPQEIKFQIDDHLKQEIKRMEEHAAGVNNSVIVQCQQFTGYGKAFMKQQKIHPDSFVQMGLQLAYYNLHNSVAPTYETGTMRVYYHGRTETVRSCSIEVKEWLEKMGNKRVKNTEKIKYFKNAANAHHQLMSDARKGNGFDRHFFGLWCLAHENQLPIPEFYEDPLYAKSGGGGNFILSTSTLGYSISVGFVAPMVLDGYGIFYSMLDDCVWIIITSYRDSEITSSKKFYNSFANAMHEIRDVLESPDGGKL